MILVERPYKTKVHPYLFSAMSYVPNKSNALPSTLGMSMLISKYTKLGDDEVDRWFRDSWKCLSQGVVLLNVLVEASIGETISHSQKVAFQSFMRDYLRYMVRKNDIMIDIISIVGSVKSVAESIMSTVGRGRDQLRVHELVSPASREVSQG